MLFLVASMLLGHGHHGAHGHGAGHPHVHLGHPSASASGHGAGHGTSHPGAQGGAHAPAAKGSGQTSHGTGQGAGQKSGPDNMSIWSFQTVLLFVGGFGIGGYFASIALLGFVLTMLAGCAAGTALAAIGYSGINFFYRRQSDSNIPSEDYVGLTGIVVTSIGAGAVGQVRCQIGDSRDVFLAKCVDGAAVPINSTVRVVDMIGTTAIVEPLGSAEQLEPQWRHS